MFTADGMPIPCNDKSMLLSEIGKIKTKILLSHTKTKVTLTQIHAETAEARFKASTGASYTIIYGEKIVSNMDIVEDHSHNIRRKRRTHP